MAGVLRAGVIGAGAFGVYHAEKYAAIEGVELTAILDSHPERARSLAERCGGAAYCALPAFLDAVDIVSIVTPASAHAAGALAALRAGRHVYVEKPIATAPEDADAILAAARAGGLVAACGFLERALFEVIGLPDIPEPALRLEAVRRNRPASRNLDVSVILDLMIHDLDLALLLARAEPLAVEATGTCLANRTVDEVEAEIDFEDGFCARLAAGRLAERPERAMRLVYASGEVSIDFLSHAFTNTTPYALDAGFATTPASRDRLGASLAAFVAAVRGEAPSPLADAADGARALDLALAVEQAVGG
jgi:predicted dehydrogenase